MKYKYYISLITIISISLCNLSTWATQDTSNNSDSLNIPINDVTLSDSSQTDDLGSELDEPSSELNPLPSTNVGFIGVDITPTMIDITLPLDYSFVIGSDGDISADLTYINNTFTTIELYVSDVVNGEYTDTTIVAPDKYSDREWEYLDLVETHKDIALGLKRNETGEEYWLHQDMPFLLTSIEPRGQDTFQFISKHGNKWASNVILEYKVHLIAHLPDTI